MLGKGSDVHVRINAGDTPLHAAASGGFGAVIQMLLDQGADVNHKNKDGWTPLFRAAVQGGHGVQQRLLDKTAQTSKRRRPQRRRPQRVDARGGLAAARRRGSRPRGVRADAAGEGRCGEPAAIQRRRRQPRVEKRRTPPPPRGQEELPRRRDRADAAGPRRGRAGADARWGDAGGPRVCLGARGGRGAAAVGGDALGAVRGVRHGAPQAAGRGVACARSPFGGGADGSGSGVRKLCCRGSTAESRPPPEGP